MSNGWLVGLKVCFVETNFQLRVKIKYIGIEKDYFLIPNSPPTGSIECVSTHMFTMKDCLS